MHIISHSGYPRSGRTDAVAPLQGEDGPPGESDGPFPGDGEIHALLRSVDWSATPLGDASLWPKSLIGTVRLILELPTPAIVFWGPQFTQIYNPGYAAIMGPLHPTYFGAPAAACWPDTYPAIEPVMRRVMAGQAEKFDEAYFPVIRYGFREEAYFTLTFSPLRDDAGRIAGIYQPIAEVTREVLAKRRAQVVHDLAQATGASAAISVLCSNPKDVPFAAILLCNDTESRCEVAAASDSLQAHDLAAFCGAARTALDTQACIRIDDFGFAPMGPWGEPTPSAYVVPILQARRGVVVLGISPQLHFDDAYRRFLQGAAAAFERAMERASLVAREARARQEADLQKERLASLFMQAPMPVCVLRGPEHVIELANRRMCEVWQRKHADVIERPLFDAVDHLSADLFKGLLDGVLQTGRPYVGRELPAEFPATDGGASRDVWLNFVYEPLRDVNGDTVGVFVVAFDVTHEILARAKMAEGRDAAQRASRGKDEFLAMLAHELRNPLGAISNATQVLRHLTRDNAGVRQPREVIERQLQHLSCLVDDLLDMSRMSWGKISLKLEVLSLASVLQRAVEANLPLFDARDQQLTLTLPSPAVQVMGDPTRLVQVFGNLLNNAAKYTQTGGHVALHAATAAEEAVIRIRDNGCGISESLLPHVFELFTQGGSSLDRSQGGLGVGLALVHSLVRLHGGEVEAHSAGLGQGSEFLVRLPLASTGRDAEQASPGEAMPGTATPAEALGVKVLVVEDNADAAEMLVIILRQAGHDVRLAADGFTALQAVRDFQPQVVLCDIGLPGMSGFELGARLREQPECQGTLLVAMSGYGRDEDRRLSRSSGFDHHLSKPVPIEVLTALIEQRRIV